MDQYVRAFVGFDGSSDLRRNRNQSESALSDVTLSPQTATAQPQHQRGYDAGSWTNEERIAHLHRVRGDAEPVVKLADDIRAHRVGGNIYAEEVNANPESTQVRPGDIVHVGCRRSQPHQ